jgi:hypothetical protein
MQENDVRVTSFTIWIYNDKLNKWQGPDAFGAVLTGRPLLLNELMASVLRFLAVRWRIAGWLTNSRLRT